MSNELTSRDMGLRAWAETRCEEAAVELLIGFNGGHLASGPWVRRTGHGTYCFDPEVAAAESGHLSGGERRVLGFAMSLVSADHPVDLGEAITGIDPKVFVLITLALSKAHGLAPSFHDMNVTHDATEPTDEEKQS